MTTRSRTAQRVAGPILVPIAASGSATYQALTLVTAAGSGPSFTPGAGTFDVSLSQATLGAGATWAVAGGVSPALAVLTRTIRQLRPTPTATA